MKKSLVLSIVVALYSLLQGTISYLLYERYTSDAEIRANSLVTKNVYVYQGLIDAFRPLPESIFLTFFNFDDFKSHVAEANSAPAPRKEHLRKVLFETMYPTYEKLLSPKGFSQLQLHLQNGERFLQLFDPLVYGDSSLPASGLESLNKSLVFTEGYNFDSGDYHYFFPIFHKNERVGTIEMSISFEFFHQLASKALNLKVQKIFPTTFTKYDLMEFSFASNQKNDLFVENLLLKEQSSLVLNDKSALTAFALLGTNGKPSAYLVALKEDYVIATLRSQFVEDTLASSVLLVTVIILALLYYRYLILSNNIQSHDSTLQIQTDTLKRQNAFMHTLFQTIPSPAFLKSPSGEFLKCNEAFANLFGKPANEIIGSATNSLLYEIQAKKAVEMDNYVLSTQNPLSYEQCMRVGGDEKDFIVQKNILKSNGEVLGIVGIMQEITDRKKYQEKLEHVILEKNIQQAQLMHDSEIINRYAIFVKLDKSGVILNASEAMASISGFSKKELIGKKWQSFCKEPNEIVNEIQKQFLLSNKWEGVLSFARKDGNAYWLRCTLLTQKNQDEDLKTLIVFATDASNEVRIRGLSYIDELTQIYNRRKLVESLENALRVVKRYPNEQSALIFFDIDNFKTVNDTHGHLVGDAILQELSLLVKDHLREIDTFARWGGEEFAIIAPKTDMQGAIKITEKLRSLISNYHFKKAEHITCSFGVTEIKSSDTNNTLIERVDKALYISKNKGKNRIEFLG
ncbi:MAG: diguanylate cyclase [Campylobacteraceae bacterium]|nr:diguanylate cyclase [Campylobacteraceae bacterium]